MPHIAIQPIFSIDISIPIGSMYCIFTYIYHKNQPHVGKYTIHGWYGIYWYQIHVPFCGIYRIHMHLISHSCCPCLGEEHVEEGVTIALPVGLAATCASHVREANQPAGWQQHSCGFFNPEYTNLNHFLMETFLENSIILCDADTSQSLCRGVI